MHLGGPHDGRKLPRIDPDDVLLRTVGPDRAVGGVVYSASAVIDPGVIEVEQPKSRVVLGEPNGTLSPRVAALADLITKGGISGEATTEIRTEIWNKLIGNLAGGHVGGAVRVWRRRTCTPNPAARDAALRVMHEAAAIAQALGARPGTNHDGRVASQSAMDHKPSILQDLELGRPMEIDGIVRCASGAGAHRRRRDPDARPAGRTLQTSRPRLGPLLGRQWRRPWKSAFTAAPA